MTSPGTVGSNHGSVSAAASETKAGAGEQKAKRSRDSQEINRMFGHPQSSGTFAESIIAKDGQFTLSHGKLMERFENLAAAEIKTADQFVAADIEAAAKTSGTEAK